MSWLADSTGEMLYSGEPEAPSLIRVSTRSVEHIHAAGSRVSLAEGNREPLHVRPLAMHHAL